MAKVIYQNRDELIYERYATDDRELGRRIETSSFSIIDDAVGDHEFDFEQWQVVRRVIHSTADFEFKTLSKLSDDAIDAGDCCAAVQVSDYCRC